jgi:hypothetical protein
MSEIIDRAHKAGLSMSPRFVQYLQKKIAKMPKAKAPTRTYKAKRWEFANFVRSQPLSVTPREVIAAAKAAGLKVPKTALQSVYSARSDMKRKGIKPAPAAPGPKLRVKKGSRAVDAPPSTPRVFEPAPDGIDWGRAFRQAVLHLGIDPARRLLDELESGF